MTERHKLAEKRRKQIKISLDEETDQLIRLVAEELNENVSDLMEEAVVQFLNRHKTALDLMSREFLWVMEDGGLAWRDLWIGEITKKLEDKKPEPELDESEILEYGSLTREEARKKRQNGFLD